MSPVAGVAAKGGFGEGWGVCGAWGLGAEWVRGRQRGLFILLGVC